MPIAHLHGPLHMAHMARTASISELAYKLGLPWKAIDEGGISEEKCYKHKDER